MPQSNMIVLDLETKRTFEEVGSRDNLGGLGVSVVGVYSYRHNEFQTYWEVDFPRLAAVLAEHPRVIGFNQRRFDMPVLQPYFKEMDLQKLPMVDILEDLHRTLGHRVKLDSVAAATLGKGKSGHGLDAIRYWNAGELDKLKQYCLDDVRITKEVFEYGAKHGEVFYFDRNGLKKLNAKVEWTLEASKEKQISLF